MGGLKALTLAGLVALASGAAVAADLPAPPPPPAPVIAAPEPDFGGWYLRADVGVGINTISRLRSSFAPGFVVDNPMFDSSSSLGDSMIIGGGVGYQFNSWLRADFTGEYRSQTDYRAIQSYGPTFCGAPSGRCYDTYNGKVGAAVFLANGYADLGTWAGITPYVGVGLGLANLRYANLTDMSAQPAGGFGYAQNGSKTNFAWALMAGVGYNVTNNLKLELGYRYLNMGRAEMPAIVCVNTAACGFERQSFRFDSHDIRLGFRYMFGDAGMPQPMAMAAPLVRKY